MQFAGGMPLARVAEEWERDTAWVEAAVRRALLESIPRRDGGMKLSRVEVRTTRGEKAARVCWGQTGLDFEQAQPVERAPVAIRDAHERKADTEAGDFSCRVSG
jgi:hypothetical protein